MVDLLGTMSIICLFGLGDFIQIKFWNLKRLNEVHMKKQVILHRNQKGEHENSSPFIFIRGKLHRRYNAY